MNTFKKTQQRVKFTSLDLIQKLEYNSSKKALKIIDKFLSSKDLYTWLSSGYYDFKYTPEQFLRKLCLIFEFDYKDIDDELKKQTIYYDEVKRVQKNYIFVNTNFKRKNEPIFTLACLEHTRRIKLEVKKVVFKNKAETLKIVSKIVQEHYKRNDGKINIWGEIVNYIYYHDNEVFTFSKEAEIIENSHTVHSKATLTLKGKNLC